MTAPVMAAAADEVDLGLTPDELRQLYAELLLTRRLDERMLQLNKIGKAPFVISCQGQEGAQIGAAAALAKGSDWFLPYYRDLALCLHLGLTPREIMLSLYAKPADPSSGGRQMPAHYGSRRLKIVTGSSPVATQVIHATGIAYAAKLRGDGSVTYVSFGEGGASTGDFHEGLNFASIHQLPVVFFCQNNGMAISVPQAKQMAVKNVADRAAAYAMPGVIVDGTDVLAVYRVVRDAAARARAGAGPTLVEAKCFRFQPHSGDDDDRHYRTPDEIAFARAHDPLPRFRQTLEERGVLDDAQHEAIAARVKAIIDDATAYAEAAPDADPATLTHHVYASPAHSA